MIKNRINDIKIMWVEHNKKISCGLTVWFKIDMIALLLFQDGFTSYKNTEILLTPKMIPTIYQCSYLVMLNLFLDIQHN